MVRAIATAVVLVLALAPGAHADPGDACSSHADCVVSRGYSSSTPFASSEEFCYKTGTTYYGPGCSSSPGPIELSSSCSEYNCFDGAHINGYDISCDTGVSEADCAEKCCSQTNCTGFDYSEIDHGMGAGRCCTGYVSRVEGGFQHNGGTYRSCEKNSVTNRTSCPPAPHEASAGTCSDCLLCSAGPSPYGNSIDESCPSKCTTDPTTGCWIDVITESHYGKKCWEKGCPPLHTKGGNWCKLHEMAAEKVCCGDDCCEPNGGAIAGVVIGVVIGLTLLIVSSCYCGRCGCFRYRRDQLIIAAAAASRPQQPQVVYVQQAPAKVAASV